MKEEIFKSAKKGMTPSAIGVVLRDSLGIAQVNSITGSKILRILKTAGLAPELPEDLYHLIKKAVNIRRHLVRRLHLIRTCYRDGFARLSHAARWM